MAALRHRARAGGSGVGASYTTSPRITRKFTKFATSTDFRRGGLSQFHCRARRCARPIFPTGQRAAGQQARLPEQAMRNPTLQGLAFLGEAVPMQFLPRSAAPGEGGPPPKAVVEGVKGGSIIITARGESPSTTRLRAWSPSPASRGRIGGLTADARLSPSEPCPNARASPRFRWSSWWRSA